MQELATNHLGFYSNSHFHFFQKIEDSAIDILYCTPQQVAQIMSERGFNSFQKFGGVEQVQSRLRLYSKQEAKANLSLSYEEKQATTAWMVTNANDY